MRRAVNCGERATHRIFKSVEPPCMIVAFRASPHRWTLLLPSGAPVRGQAAPSTGYVWMLKGSFRARQRHRGADLNVVILLDDSFPLVAPPVDVAASVRSARPEADGVVQRFHSLSLAALSRPASPARAPSPAPATAAPQRWSGTVVVRLQTSRARVHGDLHTLGQARGVCVAGCRLGGSRRKDEEAERDVMIPTPALG